MSMKRFANVTMRRQNDELKGKIERLSVCPLVCPERNCSFRDKYSFCEKFIDYIKEHTDFDYWKQTDDSDYDKPNDVKLQLDSVPVILADNADSKEALEKMIRAQNIAENLKNEIKYAIDEICENKNLEVLSEEDKESMISLGGSADDVIHLNVVLFVREKK